MEEKKDEEPAQEEKKEEPVAEQPAAAEPPVSLSVEDLVNVMRVINVASERGAFKAAELSSVGVVHDRIAKFIDASQKAAAAALPKSTQVIIRVSVFGDKRERARKKEKTMCQQKKSKKRHLHIQKVAKFSLFLDSVRFV